MGQALLINALFFINQSLAYNFTLLVRVLHSVVNYLSLFWFRLSFFSQLLSIFWFTHQLEIFRLLPHLIELPLSRM